jgi:hypothetical protein
VFQYSQCGSPAALLALVLLGEPALERREVLEDRRGVDLAGAGQLEQRILPGLAGTEASIFW